jgi:hypothetical protein
MKIYRLRTHHPHIGHELSWYSNKRDAWRDYSNWVKAEEEVNGESEHLTGEVELMEVPTTKAGLIDWLNTFLKTDNG